MEYMSMTHTHAATLHLRPKVDDTLVSNFREPILTLIEDTSSGIHDTLIAACDPARYKNLGVEDWQVSASLSSVRLESECIDGMAGSWIMRREPGPCA